MIVITLTNCPPSLRGDLTKWLLEIDSCVYVGNVNARVRELLWNRVCDNVGSGSATMAYSSDNEQRLEFKTHNTRWVPVDYEGLKLIRKPLLDSTSDDERTYLSKAGNQLKTRGIQSAMARRKQNNQYTVIDLETTGLQENQHEIIEIAALRCVGNEILEKYETYVKTCGKVPVEITELTGINDEMLRQSGKNLQTAIEEFIAFIGQDELVCHNAQFENRFLKRACKKLGIPVITNKLIDTCYLAKKYVDDIENYKLETLATYFGINYPIRHRAMADCIVTAQVYEKLKERVKKENGIGEKPN